MTPEFQNRISAERQDNEVGGSPLPVMGVDASTPMALETACLDLFYGLSSELCGRFKSVVFYNDQHFRPIKGRTFQDIHAFFELVDGTFFHLRAYGSHMSDNSDTAKARGVFLTAYHKDKIQLGGGSHAIRQDWYPFDSKILAEHILSQTNLLIA